MKYVCDARSGRTWFRIETEAEAVAESEAMRHAVARYFQREAERAGASYNPQGVSFIERDIGRKAHVARTMPLFLTLRADDGEALVTAMLPPEGKPDPNFRIVIVAAGNADPYPLYLREIDALGAHFNMPLPRDRCFPYG